MVLLHVLNSLAKKNRWKISVAHFNHQLRGRASDADEKLVRQTAAKLEAAIFRRQRADVKQFAAQSKISVEMAARKLRHEFFARMARRAKNFRPSRWRITRTTRWNFFSCGCCAARAAKVWRE